MLKDTILERYFGERLYTNAFFLMGNTILSGGSGLFFWILSAKYYSAGDVGFGSAIISAIGFLAAISLLGFDIGLIRYLPEEKDKSKVINTSFILCGCTALIISTVFLIGIDIWAPALKLLRGNPLLEISVIIFTVASTFYLLQSNIFVAFGQARYSFWQAIIALSRIPFLVLLASLGTFGIYSSNLLSSILSIVICHLFIYKIYINYTPFTKIDHRPLRKMVKYSLGNYLANIFFLIPSMCVPVLVSNTLGTKTNAYFYISWWISELVRMVPLATTTSMFAEGSASTMDINKTVVEALKFIFLLMGLVFAGVILFGQSLLSLFGGDYADNSFSVLLLFCIGDIPFAFIAVYIARCRIEKALMPVIAAYGALGAITLIASYILMQTMGIVGIGYAWIMGNILVSLPMVWRLKKIRNSKGTI